MDFIIQWYSIMFLISDIKSSFTMEGESGEKQKSITTHLCKTS